MHAARTSKNTVSSHIIRTYMRGHTLHQQSIVDLCGKPIIYVSRICRIKKRVSSLYILITHAIMSQCAGGDDHKLIH